MTSPTRASPPSAYHPRPPLPPSLRNCPHLSPRRPAAIMLSLPVGRLIAYRRAPARLAFPSKQLLDPLAPQGEGAGGEDGQHRSKHITSWPILVAGRPVRPS